MPPLKAIGETPVVVRPPLHNRMVDAMLEVEKTRLGKATTAKRLPISQTSVMVRNDTEADLPRGAVVDVGDYILDRDDAEFDPANFWCEGIEQAYGEFGVVRDPLPDGEIGECQLFGPVFARVLVKNFSHRYAIPVAGQNYFVSSPIGPVKIIAFYDDEASIDTVQLCGVNLRVPPVPQMGVAVDTIGHSTIGTVSLVKQNAAGAYSYLRDGDSEIITCEAYAYSLNSGESIAAGFAVWLNWTEWGHIHAVSGNCSTHDWSIS